MSNFLKYKHEPYEWPFLGCFRKFKDIIPLLVYHRRTQVRDRLALSGLCPFDFTAADLLLLPNEERKK
jgi:hypothetical protein